MKKCEMMTNLHCHEVATTLETSRLTQGAKNLIKTALPSVIASKLSGVKLGTSYAKAVAQTERRIAAESFMVLKFCFVSSR